MKKIHFFLIFVMFIAFLFNPNQLDFEKYKIDNKEEYFKDNIVAYNDFYKINQDESLKSVKTSYQRKNYYFFSIHNVTSPITERTNSYIGFFNCFFKKPLNLTYVNRPNINKEIKSLNKQEKEYVTKALIEIENFEQNMISLKKISNELKRKDISIVSYKEHISKIYGETLDSSKIINSKEIPDKFYEFNMELSNAFKLETEILSSYLNYLDTKDNLISEKIKKENIQFINKYTHAIKILQEINK